MPLLSRFSSTVRTLFRKEQLDHDLDEELQAYLELLVDEKIGAGMDPEQARWEARLELGGKEQVKENVRDVRRGAMMDGLLQDIRYGLRMMNRRRGFTITVVLILALGIGANTAVYSIGDAALIRTLPVENPEELVILNWTVRKDPFSSMVRRISGWIRDTDTGLQMSSSFCYPIYKEFRDRNEVLSRIFCFTSVNRLNLNVDGQAELASGQLVGGGYFAGLKLEPQLGRFIGVEDDRAGAPPAAVIAYGYWQRRFGGAAEALGKNIYVNSHPFTIVGVSPPEFEGIQQVGRAASIFIPMALQSVATRREDALTNAGNWWLQIMGRLKPGKTFSEAQAQLDVILKQESEIYLTRSEEPESSENTPDRPKMALTSGRRGLNEQREEMTNLSLGAGRRRVIRQFLTESLMLALLGGLFSVFLSYWGQEALMSQLDLNLAVGINGRVLAFALGLVLLTGVLFGLAPALRTSGVNLLQSLKISSTGGERGPGLRLGLSRTLVVVQVALSLLLLVAAGLFVRTLQNLERVEIGFNPDRLLLFQMDPTLNGYEGIREANFHRDVKEAVEGLPGVRGATSSIFSPLSGNTSMLRFFPQGREDEKLGVFVRLIEPNFCRTMEIPLLLGRDLEQRDDENNPKVALINETLARKIFSAAIPVGRRFGFDKPERSADIEVVGVVKDSRNAHLRGAIEPTVYIPYRQMTDSMGSRTFSVRTSRDPLSVVDDVRRAVASIDGNVPMFGVKTLNGQIDELLYGERTFAGMAGLLGILALTLTCIGIYGILSYTVVQRTQEIGVRMALGAQKWDVVQLIMREMLMVAGGAVIGLAAALAGTRILSSFLFGLTPTDPATLSSVTLLMAGVAAIAVYLPARQASRLDPLAALRYE
jgi:ABC-type antimicrobial peptide transport system permease subunit